MAIIRLCRRATFQAVPDAGFADDQLRIRRIHLDLLPQLTHQNTKILDVAGVMAPNLADELLVGND